MSTATNGKPSLPHEKLRTAADSRPKCHHGVERCSFDARTDAFRKIIGDDPVFSVLAEGPAEKLCAHEAATFLEYGAGGYHHPCLIFTTKPYVDAVGQKVVDIKRLALAGPSCGKVDVLHTSGNCANGGTLGFDGRLYFCFQGPKGPKANTDQYYPAGIFSVDPHDFTDWRKTVDQWSDGGDGWEPLHFNSPNDVVMRSDGSVWFTDPSYAHAQGLSPPPQLGEWVWRYDLQTNACDVVADGFARPNGIVFSPNEEILYVTDTGWITGWSSRLIDPAGPRSIYAFDVCCKGRRLQNRRLLYTADKGIPDGIAVDALGNIYTGCADGVHVISPDGTLLGKILCKGCEGGAANLCFGQGSLSHKLYILAEAAIICVDCKGVVGAPVGKESREGGKSASSMFSWFFSPANCTRRDRIEYEARQ